MDNIGPPAQPPQGLETTGRMSGKKMFLAITALIILIAVFFLFNPSGLKKLFSGRSLPVTPASPQASGGSSSQAGGVTLPSDQMKNLLVSEFATLSFPEIASQQKTDAGALPPGANQLILTGASQIETATVSYSNGQKGYSISYNFGKSLPIANSMLTGVITGQGQLIMARYGETFGYAEGRLGDYNLKIYEKPLSVNSINVNILALAANKLKK